jgi:HK97 gp10 family phage protein
MVDIESNLSGDLSGALDKFEKSIQEKVLFSGIAAMAKVIYDEVKLNAPESEKEHWFHGTSFKKTGQKYLFQPGTLKSSIYRVYSPEKSSDTKKTYKVSWNHTKAPYGFMVEFGTSRAPAHPFLRPAFDRVNDAIEAGKARMSEKIHEITGES